MRKCLGAAYGLSSALKVSDSQTRIGDDPPAIKRETCFAKSPTRKFHCKESLRIKKLLKDIMAREQRAKA